MVDSAHIKAEDMVRQRLPAFVEVTSTLFRFMEAATQRRDRENARRLKEAIGTLKDLVTDMGVTPDEFNDAVAQLNFGQDVIRRVQMQVPTQPSCANEVCGGRGFIESETWWDHNGRRHYWKEFRPCPVCNSDQSKPIPQDIRR